MDTLQQIMEEARSLEARGLTTQALVKTDETPSEQDLAWHADHGCAVLTHDARVARTCAASGMDPLATFLAVASASDQDLVDLHGRCRYLLERQEDIARLDQLVGPLLSGGYLEEVALRVMPAGAGGTSFSAADIPTFGRALRRSRNLAARNVLVPVAGDDLSQAARDAFSLVKQLRSDLPCVWHSFCLEGLLGPLAAGDEELARTVGMLCSLNDTSLYAQFYLA